MKVALILERMNPSLGGREAYTAALATSLARKGVDVTIICQRARWSNPDVRITEVGARGLARHRRLANFVADARRAIDSEQFDITHAMLPIPGADIYHPHGGTVPAQHLTSLRMHGPLGRAIRQVFGGLNLVRRTSGQLERHVARDASTCCLCVSGMVAREFQGHYGRADNVRTIPNGVAIPNVDQSQIACWRRQKRSELGIADDELVFLTVGSNWPLKGVPEAIKAFARWMNNGSLQAASRLVALGSRDARAIAHCKRLAMRLGVGRQVSLVGPSSDIFQWYCMADVLVQLTWYDSFGLAMMEAAACGCAVITSAFAGAAEGLDGCIVVDCPDDISAAAAAMEELAEPARRAARAKLCMESARSFTQEGHVAQVLELYREIVSSRKTSLAAQPL